MQLTQEPKKVIRSGEFQESKFKIEASSKAFQILSSKLYSDEYRAIVRELCTNASDAHAVAGITEPIVVTAPTSMNATFSVQDFGKGIDPSEFEKIYTTYFYSTKTSSNTEVGCFGLGSKSPFAYTQQFTVENCFGGTKYTYTCYINENGEPSVTLLMQSPTDQTGVKVSFPVKREHFYKFENAIKDVLKWFDVTPKCNIGIENLSFKERTKNFQYGNGLLADYNVRMGQVIYPVDSKYFEDFLYAGSVINLEIGEVDITPSRESLEYRKKTIDVLEKINAELGKEFNAKVQEIMTDSSLSEYSKFMAMHKYLHKRAAKPTLKTSTITSNFPNAPAQDTLCKVDNSKFDNKLAQVTKESWRKKLEFEKTYMYIHSSTVIFIKDKKNHINAKLWDIIQKTQQLGTVGRQRVDIIVVPSEVKDTFMKEYGITEDDVIYASKYDMGDQTIVTTVVSNNCSKYVKTTYDGYKKQGAKITKDDQEGVYITADFYDTMQWHTSTKLLFEKEYIAQGSPKLFIFTENQYNTLKIQNRKKFVNFLDGIAQNVIDKRNDIVTEIANDIVVDSYLHERSMQIGEKSTTNNLFKRYYNSYKDKTDTDLSSESAGYYEGLMELIKWHKKDLYEEIKREITDKTVSMQKLREDAIKKYPLSKISLESTTFNDIINDVVEYVDLMESKGE